MRKSSVTYSQLEAAFQEIGFQATYGEYPQGAFYVRFASGDNDTVVILKSGREDQLVDAADILSATITLDGRGIIDREQFARLLERYATPTAKAA